MNRAHAQHPLVGQPGVAVALAVAFESPELQTAVEYVLRDHGIAVLAGVEVASAPALFLTFTLTDPEDGWRAYSAAVELVGDVVIPGHELALKAILWRESSVGMVRDGLSNAELAAGAQSVLSDHLARFVVDWQAAGNETQRMVTH